MGQLAIAGLAAAGGRFTRDRLAVYLEPCQVNIASGAVAAARHQIRKANFVHFAEIRVIHPDFVRWSVVGPESDRAIWIQFDPPDSREGKLTLHKYWYGGVRVIS